MTTESEIWKVWKEVSGLAAIGGVIAFGKMMAEPKRPGVRIIIGRTIVGSGLSVAAGAALTLFPDLPPLAVTGIGAVFGILGQQYLELLATRALNRRRPIEAPTRARNRRYASRGRQWVGSINSAMSGAPLSRLSRSMRRPSITKHGLSNML
ncbi:hypothetical protein CFB52_022490 [Burkholderia sp. AU18528]|nr:hypothetical protein CFB52_022490 [Burkholderia sp. AU18528]RQX81528.1 hypothetical protein DF034_17820 [Burkholderia anthina]